MNNNINIAEILRDCPKGMKLYSPVCGASKLKLINLGMDGVIIVVGSISNGKSYAFNEDGSFTSASDAECLLFPSKDMRDWSKFFHRGDVVYNPSSQMYAIFDGWVDGTYTEFNTTLNLYPNHEIGEEEVCKTECFVIVKAGTREHSSVMQDFEKLFNGKYSPDTLRVEPIKKRHEFKPFDRVLARESDHKIWYAEIFSHFSADTSEYVCIGGAYDQCIPYNEGDSTPHRHERAIHQGRR